MAPGVRRSPYIDIYIQRQYAQSRIDRYLSEARLSPLLRALRSPCTTRPLFLLILQSLTRTAQQLLEHARQPSRPQFAYF